MVSTHLKNHRQNGNLPQRGVKPQTWCDRSPSVFVVPKICGTPRGAGGMPFQVGWRPRRFGEGSMDILSEVNAAGTDLCSFFYILSARQFNTSYIDWVYRWSPLIPLPSRPSNWKRKSNRNYGRLAKTRPGGFNGQHGWVLRMPIKEPAKTRLQTPPRCDAECW